MTLKTLKIEAEKAIIGAQDLKGLNDVYKKYLGKEGELTRILRSLEKLPKAKRVKVGKETNNLKNVLTIKFDQRTQVLKEKAQQEAEEKEWIDVSAPGKRPVLGHLHPLTQVRRKIEEIFQTMGFAVVEGPEMETEWYHFDALNIPKNHPARDLWDTFYLRNGLLLRAQTSPVQIRYMEKNNPPLRIIAPGRCFRHEATDASHEHTFHQIEGLVVGRDISLANLKVVLESFMKRFFGEGVILRWQPSYFPFVEPGLELLMRCSVCQGKGCSTCGNSGWLEVIPCGMVHPNVFKAAGYNPKFWQGFAFGMGLDRLAMMKYKINDIRLFCSGDLRFLNQF
ncbi:MAG: phenylalanine--tRNA ligase subunit alpha [Candidatus Nealsonbacteria bacterium CG09_land_8_20_14_0_10_42_14]|uniref:Phenylalanine--tRNA ligase alpha subunit n=1 Tax=Candidatus Nealsonbacteria bacterium CG09_land_8_20_14_0_10_42_14 TaxID=1974707 RepID=A0A2H0WXA9_9BACT|nr:MAG: phenylalanine--tRNA ligase subunit alpha [Candidatus Nealsonbacteria bacterium CG09_land_8_20_14_0_10_42_14]